jgi:2-succinyl-5-enolpyruvyl-6-hydroxy-3-cyclohexene-1-carboxylate synthase
VEARNPSHACALVLVDELARHGVTDAVLAPGSRSAALAMAFHDDPRIRLHVEVDERSAGFLAIGLARATGRPAPVVVTSGSAVANLHPAVVEADTGRVPLVLLTADRPPELRETGANQAIDQLGIFGRAPRWHVELGVAEDRPSSNALWRTTVGRAISASTGAGGGAPGPVHVNVPFREPTVPLADDGRAPAVPPFASPLEGRSGGRPWLTATRAPRRLLDAELEGLAARLLTTERGLLVAGATGPGDRAGAAAAALHELARATGWPVVAEPSSGFRTDPATTLTHGPILLGHPGFARRHVPDLVLRIGRTGLSRELGGLLSPTVPQLLLAPDGDIDDPERSIPEVLVADLDVTLAALSVSLGLPASSEWGDRWRAADAAVAAAVRERLEHDDLPSEPRTARDVVAAVPAGATFVVASSMPIRDVDRFAAPRPDVRVLANRGASGIDGFVSTVLGVALGTEAPVVALAGDLSFLHDVNGLLLRADAPTVDATFVVVDNDGGGIFSFLPQAGFPSSFERVFGTPHGRDLAAVAAAHGAPCTEVTDAGALTGAVAEAIAAGGVQVVLVRTERQANLDLHRELTSLAHAALDELA